MPIPFQIPTMGETMDQPTGGGGGDFRLSDALPFEQAQGPRNGGLPAAAMNVTQYFGQAQERANEQKMASQIQMKTDHTSGTTDVTAPSQLVQQMLQKAQAFDQIQANYYQKQLEANQARMQQIQANPWANTLATIAGSVAQQSHNPIVRGLGQAAQQLNPSLQQLQAQQMQLLQGQGQSLQRSAALASTIQSGQRQQAQLGMEQERLALEKEREQRLLSGAEMSRLAAIDTKWDDRAAKGLFSEKDFAREYKTQHPKATDAEVAEAVAGKKEIQAQAEKLRAQLGDEEFKKQERKAKLEYENDKKLAALRHQYTIDEIQERNKGKLVNPKTGKPMTAAEEKQMADIETTTRLLDNLYAGLEKRPDLFGFGPVKAAERWAKVRLDREASQIKASYDHALPIMVKVMEEGVRGYSKAQSGFVLERVPMMSDTQEQMKGKLDFIKGYLEARQAGLDKVFVERQMMASKGGGPAPAPSHGAPAPAATTYPTATNPKTGEVVEYRDGKWQPKRK